MLRNKTVVQKYVFCFPQEINNSLTPTPLMQNWNLKGKQEVCCRPRICPLHLLTGPANPPKTQNKIDFLAGRKSRRRR